jgi:hypothetical protein
VQFGGWNGLRGIDEHTKLARASLDFDTDLDEAFHINVAKMSVVLPPTLKNMLERPVHELCMRADGAYRQAASTSERSGTATRQFSADGVALRDVGIAFKAAVLESSDLETFRSALDLFRARHPELARILSL